MAGKLEARSFLWSSRSKRQIGAGKLAEKEGFPVC